MPVENSESWIDKKQLDQWDVNIYFTYKLVDFATDIVMIPEKNKQ